MISANRVKIYIIAFTSILILIIIKVNETARNTNSEINYYLNNYQRQSQEISNIRIYDIRRPLDYNISKTINCRQSAEYYRVSVLLCLHDEKKDLISKFLFESGIWEKHQMSIFAFYVKTHPDWLVLDIGANIGTFSLMAAKLGANVISIEPFHDNVVRLHKSALQENLTHRITVINNALFDKRQIKLLNEDKENIGAQTLIDNLDKRFNKSDLKKNKYLVETILLDDIIDYLPRSGKNKKAIMKIDIEALEPYVIPTAKNLFSILKIQIIFMEWTRRMLNWTDELYRVKQLLDFLLKRNYVPYSYDSKKLELDKWINWPGDIYWIQKKLIKDHEYRLIRVFKN